MELFLPAAMALVIGLVHFFGEEIDEYTGMYSFFLVSFSAGFTVAYFFSALMPEVMRNTALPVQNASILAGFSMFYVVEEFLYGRESNLGRIREEFKEVHTGFTMLYHVAVGMILFFLAQGGREKLLLFFLPVVLHTLVNSLAMKEMHEEMLKYRYIKVLTSLSVLIGVLLNHFLRIPESYIYVLLGTVAGAFVYMVVHDALDPRKERPVGFISGVLLFIALNAALSVL
jgi:hypothetical protein